MKHANLAAAGVALALVLPWAQAPARDDEGRNSAGLVLSSVQYKEDGQPSTSLGAAGVSVEHALGRHFGIEGRLMFETSSQYVESTRVMVGLDNALSIFAKAYAPVTGSLSLYGLLGMTRGEITATADPTVTVAGGTTTGPVASGGGTYVETDLSYGVGAEYEFGKTFALSLEWAHLFEGAGFKVEGLTTRLGWRF